MTDDEDGSDHEDTPPLPSPLPRRPRIAPASLEDDASPWSAMARMSNDHPSERSIAAIRRAGRQPESAVTFLDLEVWHRALRMRDDSREERWRGQIHALISRPPPEIVDRLSAGLSQVKLDLGTVAERSAADVAQIRRDLAVVGDLTKAEKILGDLSAVRDKVNDHDRDSRFGRRLGWWALGGAFTALTLLLAVVYSRGGMDTGTEIKIQVLERRIERIDQQIDRLVRLDRGSAPGP
jgi:hypothetical protein